MTKDPLPSIVEDFAAEHPTVWDAYNQLGQAISEAGPLDEKSRRLIKLAIAVGSGREGAVRAHARRGFRAGLAQRVGTRGAAWDHHKRLARGICCPLLDSTSY